MSQPRAANGQFTTKRRDLPFYGTPDATAIAHGSDAGQIQGGQQQNMQQPESAVQTQAWTSGMGPDPESQGESQDGSAPSRAHDQAMHAGNMSQDVQTKKEVKVKVEPPSPLPTMTEEMRQRDLMQRTNFMIDRPGYGTP